jgi:hypothetical protein
MKFLFCSSALGLILLATLGSSAQAAQGSDPDWPCVQRKVPELSFGQIWTGETLPAESMDWRENEAIRELVPDLAARRLALSDAEVKIVQFAGSIAEKDSALTLSQLIQGLFETMNHERTLVISGIARYAKGQNSMAQALRQESSDLDRMRNAEGADPILVDQRQEHLIFRTRIFQERAQSLSFVCEVPTLVEQRLFALVKTIAQQMRGQ